MCVITPIDNLPSDPLDAAALFHADHLPKIRHNTGAIRPSNIVLVFEPAGSEHHAWRLAAIQGLAREFAPIRANAVVGNEKDSLDDAIAFLHDAPGVTGQLLEVGNG
ncbi:MAG TPA: hypothetical protein VFS49_05545 [Croceibacterium sp.]|nr:hypothetical protein [Croceibacterium sp.]